MVPKYPRIFRNRFRFILVPKYSTTPGRLSLGAIYLEQTSTTIDRKVDNAIKYIIS